MRNFLITQRIYTDQNGQVTDALEETYTGYFNKLGIALHPVSNFAQDPGAYVSGIQCGGLIISGGSDVSGGFGFAKGTEDQSNMDRIDRVCSQLIDAVMPRNLPILGICYGMQILNCHLGGKIASHIHKNEQDERQPGCSHAINITKDIFDLSGTYMVNHYHNHGLPRSMVAPCFEIFAEDADFDAVEGIIHKESAVMGIQWHPERKSPDDDFNITLIKNFLKIS